MGTKVAARPTGRTAVAGTTNMENVEPLLAEIGKKVTTYRAEAEAMVVNSDASAAKASELGTALATMGESIERQRSEIVSPFNKAVTAANAKFKAQSTPLKAIADLLRSKIGAYFNKKKAKALEDQRKRQLELDVAQIATAEALEDLIGRLETAEIVDEWSCNLVQVAKERHKVLKAAEKKREKVVDKALQAGKDVPLPTTPEPPPRTIAIAAEPEKKMGSSQVSERWTFKVTDISAVPVAYIEVVGAKVRRAIADGKRGTDIPGIMIEQETKVAF